MTPEILLTLASLVAVTAIGLGMAALVGESAPPYRPRKWVTVALFAFPVCGAVAILLFAATIAWAVARG